MQAKKPDAAYIKFDNESISPERLEEVIGGQGLFSIKSIVEISNVLSDKKSKDVLMDKVKEIAESENVFIIRETKVNKPELEKFKKYAKQVQCFELKVKKEVGRKFGLGDGNFFSLQDFNVFSLADALGNRDKKNLWILYQKANQLNIPAEEIHGLLFWQFKTIALSRLAKSAEEADLKPFVYSKSKRYAQNFTEKETKSFLSRLVSMYHDSHRGIYDFNIALEKFILSL
ncbi:MAG: hypothetical protein WCW87_00755 [Candidatus Paceibacterota bacterium]